MAIAVVIGVALSVLPILTRVLPPLVGEALPMADVPSPPLRPPGCCTSSQSSGWWSS